MLPRTRALAIALLMLTCGFAGLLLAGIGERAQPIVAQDAGFTASIRVNVTDEAGRPVDGATVWIRGNVTDSWMTVNGTVLITGLDDSVLNYTLWTNKSGYLDSQDLVVSVAVASTVYASLEVTGGSLWGIVTSQLGYIPANVTVVSLGYVANVSTTNGSYTIEGIPSGTYDIVAEAFGPGYNTALAYDVPITAGRMTQHDFLLMSTNGVISGIVYDSESHLPLNNTNVSVAMGNSISWKINAEDGSYQIANLTEGLYNVTATRDGYFPSTLSNVFVSRNGTSGIDFNLSERPRLIYGTVKSGTLLQPNVNVSVVGTNVFNISDSEGDYRLENLPSGIYTISAQLEGYELAIIPDVFLPKGGEVRMDIDLVALPGAIVRGLVQVRNTGVPLVGVTVTILDAQGTILSFKPTNFKGQFEFTGLADGNYTLQFLMDGYQPLEVKKIEVRSDLISNETYDMTPDRKGFTGFFFGFDLGHSMMILALFITILILAVAVYLRIRTFQAPENAPAVYDQAEEETEEEKKDAMLEAETASVIKEQRKVRKKKEGGG